MLLCAAGSTMSGTQTTFSGVRFRIRSSMFSRAFEGTRMWLVMRISSCAFKSSCHDRLAALLPPPAQTEKDARSRRSQSTRQIASRSALLFRDGRTQMSRSLRARAQLRAFDFATWIVTFLSSRIRAIARFRLPVHTCTVPNLSWKISQLLTNQRV